MNWGSDRSTLAAVARVVAAGLAVCAAAPGQGATTPTAPAQSRAAKPAPNHADWPLYRGGPGLLGVAPGTLGDAFTLAWSFATGDAIVSSPVVAGELVFVGSSDQSVYAIERATGKKRWSFKTDDMVDAPPLVHGGRVYVGSGDGSFFALDATTGKQLWKAQTGDKIVGSANLHHDRDGATRIVVGSYDNRLYCFDPTGKQLWRYETANHLNGTPALEGGQAVFGGCDAVLHMLSVRDGKRVRAVELDGDSHIAGSVAVAGGKAYFGHHGNAFVCVDLGTGKTVWTYTCKNHGFLSSPAGGDDRVVLGGRDKRLHCARRSDGKPLWTFATKRKIDGSPLICGDKVVCGSGDGRLYVVRLADGKPVWQYECGRSISSSPAIAGGWIFIGADDGRLYAFRPAAAQKPVR
ncbi:MAG: PQQ-binding-like beta-propeller repeat protein [Planctomycetes bacterium]|nr:PQQ-binding-like beta-propeller repeat protein [Planctomycetota bacterium]